MKIDEAIEVIQKDLDNEDVEWNSPLGKAYKLSFEALKLVQRERLLGINPVETLLPGETEK